MKKATGFLAAGISIILPFLLLPVYKLLKINFYENMPPIFINALLAIGLNIFVGYTGILNLGISAFIAIGAFLNGILTSPMYPFQIGFWNSLIITPLICAVFGIIIGYPTLKLSGDYLAIVTLGLGEVVKETLKNVEGITKGTIGINPVPAPGIFGKSFPATATLFWYYFTLAFLILTALLSYSLENSRIGRNWASIREDEVAASSCGINVAGMKLIAFAMAAFIAGIGGVLMTSYLQSTSDPGAYDFMLSAKILCMVILGGMGSIRGVVAGAVIIESFDRVISPWLTDLLKEIIKAEYYILDFRNWQALIVGVALLLIIRYKPEGILPSRRIKLELHEEEKSIE